MKYSMCQYVIVDLMALLSSTSVLIVCLFVLSVAEREPLKSPSITVDFIVSPCSCISFCFLYIEALTDAEMFMIFNVPLMN